MVRTKKRRWVASIAAATALLPLASCTVPADGLTGISVDGQGNWIVVLAWYCRRPDEVILYHDDPSRTEDAGTATDAVLDTPAARPTDPAKPPAGKVATMTVDMLHPQSDWTVRKAARPLDASLTYRAYSATKDNSWSTTSIDFQLSDIENLAPGQVFYWGLHNKNVVGSMDEFEKAAREGGGGC